MPVISNATVASGTGLSTAGNGGRKLVRLSNGWLVAAVINLNISPSDQRSVRLFVSKDNGGSWTYQTAQSYTTTNTNYTIVSSIVARGNRVHVILAADTAIFHNTFDFSSNTWMGSTAVDGSQQTGSIQATSLAINEAGTELHAAWSSKNATYPNSFNIRYAKGTINGDGSVTWGGVQQLTNINSSGADYKNPTMVIRSGNPTITFEYQYTADSIIACLNFNAGSWGAVVYVYRSNVVSHQQANPSSLFIPPAINGLANGRLWVAWQGRDATDSAKFNIRVSFSDDGGVTWSTPVKLTSGNTFDRLNVSLSADKAGKVFALYEDHQWSPDLGIRMRTFSGGSWGAEVGVATADTAEQHPSALVDFSLQMTTPPFVYTDTSTGVFFSGSFNAGASVSPASGALGNKETRTLTAYTVTPEAGSTVTQIVERINGTIVNTFNNPASLSRTLTVPQATWDALAYFATHTASVTVTDSNGAQTVTTYSFDKRLATGASLLEATKANNDARTRISQKRDALAAQVGLSAGSTFDAISAQLASGVFKKFASGSAGVSSGNSLTVSGLSFRPSTVFWIQGSLVGIWTSLNPNSTNYVRYASNAASNTSSFGTNPQAVISDTGFSISTGVTGPHLWFAYE
ncbi:hypothetical protein EauM23_00036 [Exiguobacterium phage vB_EauM-23]|nr:hypothetical protein EauM23_00036 [Exiguobacterium phage vB_EauM-23]